jgi:Fe-S cluster assembly iron-binding protein IscA
MTPIEIDPSRLAVSPAAAKAIVQVVGDREPTPGSGLRITTTDTPPGALLLSVVKGPHLDDHVFSFEGAALFVDREAASALTGKLLDVEVNQQGVAFFSVTSRTDTN